MIDKMIRWVSNHHPHNQKQSNSNSQRGVKISNEERERIVLDEVRRRYEFEENRQKTVETKTNITLGINALLLTLLAAFPLDLIPSIIVISLILASVILGAIILKPRNYATVGEDNIYDFLNYIREESKNSLIRDITLDYMGAVDNNEQINTRKYEWYHISYKFTIASIALISLFAIERPICSFDVQGLPNVIYTIGGSICGSFGSSILAAFVTFTLRSDLQKFISLMYEGAQNHRLFDFR